MCTDDEETKRNSQSNYVYEEIDTEVITVHYLVMLKDIKRVRIIRRNC